MAEEMTTICELHGKLENVGNDKAEIKRAKQIIQKEGQLYKTIVATSGQSEMEETDIYNTNGEGDRVEYNGRQCTVQRVHRDGRIDIQFDDGAVEYEINASDVTALDSNFARKYFQGAKKFVGGLLTSVISTTSSIFGGKNQPWEMPQGKKTSVAAVAWHPSKQRIALALELEQDDQNGGTSYYVAIYNVTYEIWEHTSLENNLQKDVRCLEWAPCAAATLAVGCRTGVCIWRVADITLALQQLDLDDGSEQSAEGYSTSEFDFLRQPSGQPVEDLAWCNKGRLLAVCARADNAVNVWDVAQHTCEPLRRLGYGVGATSLHWSPNGAHLFATTTSKTCVAWETQTWQAWKELNWQQMPGSRCRAAAWFRDRHGTNKANVLLMASSSTIYTMRFSEAPISRANYSTFTSGAGPEHLPEIVVRERELDDTDRKSEITEMAWDPSGARLAVAYKLTGVRDGQAQEARGQVIVYLVSHYPELELTLLGEILPPAQASHPHWLRFCPNFERGALLNICWNLNESEEKDLVVFYPLYFKWPAHAASY